MTNNLLILGAAQVNAALEGKEKEIIEAVKNTYVFHNDGKTSLPHSIFLRFPNDDKDRIIGLPAYIGGDFNIAGMKWISSFPGNIQNGIERASAAIFLNDMETGRVKAVLEGSIISAKRTAASAALAAKYLHSNKNEDVFGLVGCGRINREILLFVKNVYPTIKRIFLFDLSDERMDDFIAQHDGSDYEFVKCESIEELFENAKLISFATTAGVPFIDKIEALTNEHTILGISLRDLAPSVIENAHNIVDDFEHVCRERTSIHLTYQKLGNGDFVAGNIAEVVNGTVPARDPDKAAVYSPFGLGVLDLALSNYVYGSAVKNGVGTVAENFLP